MKKYVALLAIALAPISYAEKPDWISVGELLEKAISTKDKNYMSTAHLRCGALASVTAKFLGTHDNLYESYLSVADTHLMMSTKYELGVFIARGGKKENFSAKHEGKATLAVKLANQYVDWMDHNWIKTGDYVASDEELKAEIGLCGELAQGKDQMYELMNTPFENTPELRNN